ncbi:MAG TPA: tRNA (adenosine(37)-N6)-dimethylallyltransferase MiaA [Alcanivoracaceae bacterium]|nr:tRNA (adenosine(37)-N6)-dimethylallyltransferase MiaA [Alcanivoracaceae bacterium]
MSLPVILLMGPTAAGKTAVAIELAQRLPVVLVNVDSALVYEMLDIGAARPTAEELEKAPHRLMGIRKPWEPYSAAEFRADALREIKAIHAEGKIPLLVGGTMMYFRALIEGLAPLPAADPAVRETLERQAEEHGWPWLHAQLEKVDPVTAARLAPQDSQRIQRALEVYQLTGKPLSVHHAEQQQNKKSFPYPLIQFAIAPTDRAMLHERIALRLEQMFAQGLVEEVEQLRALPQLTGAEPSMRSVGYRQVWQYLAGEYDEATMKHKLLVATRQLAKRQLTWLRSWPDVHWYDPTKENVVEQIVEQLKRHVPDDYVRI